MREMRVRITGAVVLTVLAMLVMPQSMVTSTISEAAASNGTLRPPDDILHTNTWTQMSFLGPIPNRAGFEMVYDSKADRIVSVGGGPSYADQTWSYDVMTHRWVLMAYGPGSYGGHTLTYDSESDRIILFGGNTGDDRTWAFDYGSNKWTNMNPSVRPSLRLEHAAAYDSQSDRIILFGGFYSSTYLSDTWAYDYNTNTWTNMNPSTKPSARAWAGMTYDSQNDRIILFGGYDGSYRSDLWEYDYNSNTWIQRIPSSSPSARCHHGIAYDSQSKRTVIFGGESPSILQDVWAYDYTANTWAGLNPSTKPVPRSGMGMAYHAKSDRIIMFAGWNKGSSTYYNDTWSYDVDANMWSNMSSSAKPQALFGYSFSYNTRLDRIVMFGGEYPSSTRHDYTWTYDYNTNTWTDMNPSSRPLPRRSHAAVYLPKYDRMIIFGGWDSPTYYDDTWSYDLKNNTWTNMNPGTKPQARDYHSLVYDSESDLVVLFGGWTGSVALNDTWTYDYNTNKWTMMAPGGAKPSIRSSFAMEYDSQSDRAILFGGGVASTIFQDTWAYDYNSNTWTNMTSTGYPSAGVAPAMAYDSQSDRMILFGGSPTNPTYSYETWSYDFNSNTWAILNPLIHPSARRNLKMAYDVQSDRSMIFGGYDGSVYVDDTWCYDYSMNKWTNMAFLVTPSARSYHAMAYDSQSDRTILYGGAIGGTETWSYDYATNTWTNMASSPNPSDRNLHAMAYDSQSDRIVLFGGSIGSSNNDETWAYDFNSNTWTNMNPGTRPSARNGHSMAYDSQSDRIILFGGCLTAGSTCTSWSSETWAYDYNSNTWAIMNPGTYPSVRGGHRMAYDSQSDRVILFGGYGGSYQSDTWTYDYNSNAWTSMNPSSRPSGRYGFGLTYDEASDRVVLFGGYTSSSSINSETWTYDVDSNIWMLMSPSLSPSARNYLAMTYVTKADRTILFGGYSSSYLSDTWAYDYGDLVRPYVVSTSPANGATYVLPNTRINITWSERMDQTATQGAVSFSPAVTCAWSWTGVTMSCTPSSNLQISTLYTVTISTAARDQAGNTMLNTYTFSFTTLGPPKVTSTSPVNGATSVSLSSSIIVTFDQAMDRATVESSISASPSISGTFSWNAQSTTLTWTPSSYLATGTQYTVTIRTTAKSQYGLNMLTDYVFSFTTAYAPKVMSTSPANNSINVSLTTSIVIAFDQQMDRPSVESSISASPSISGTFSWGGPSSTVTWYPSSNLLHSTKYVITIKDTAKSQYNAKMLSDFVFTFTTILPPKVISTQPVNGDTNVSVSTNIVIRFDQPMDAASTQGAISASPSIAGTFSWNTNGDTVTWNPSTDLNPMTQYTITISTGAKSKTGLSLPANYVFSFTTGAIPPPYVVWTSPSGTGIPLKASIGVKFNEAMDKASVQSALEANPPISGTFSWDASSSNATWTPLSDLQHSTQYTITVKGTAKSQKGMAMGTAYSFGFTTAYPPTVVSTSPADGSTDIPASTDIILVFNQPMEYSSTQSAISASPSISGSFSWSANEDTMAWNPSQDLALGTKYTVTLLTGAKSKAGVNIATPFTFTFTTSPIIPPAVVWTYPAQGERNVSVKTNIMIAFNQEMDRTSVESATSSTPSITVTFSWDLSYTNMTLMPSSNLQFSTKYTMTIDGQARAKSGLNMSSDFVFSFTTESGTQPIPPKVVATYPTDNAVDVPVSVAISIFFSKPMDTSTTESAFKIAPSTTGTFSWVGTRMDFLPSAPLLPSTMYVVWVTKTAKDVDGIALPLDHIFTFKTKAIDTTPPSVISVIPMTGATNVSVNTSIEVDFSESMDKSTISFSINPYVNGSISWDVPGTIMLYKPKVPLAKGTKYSITILSGASDISGNHMKNDFLSNFTTKGGVEHIKNGTLKGMVLCDGAAVPDVQISVRNHTTNSLVASTMTDSRGVYSVSLPPDNYTVIAEKDGYERSVTRDVTVQSDQIKLLDLTIAKRVEAVVSGLVMWLILIIIVAVVCGLVIFFILYKKRKTSGEDRRLLEPGSRRTEGRPPPMPPAARTAPPPGMPPQGPQPMPMQRGPPPRQAPMAQRGPPPPRPQVGAAVPLQAPGPALASPQRRTQPRAPQQAPPRQPVEVEERVQPPAPMPRPAVEPSPQALGPAPAPVPVPVPMPSEQKKTPLPKEDALTGIEMNGSTLAVDESPEHTMRAFATLVSSGKVGLCVSSFPTDDLKRGALGNIPGQNLKFVQITMENVPDALEPNRVVALTARINRFMRDNGRGGVVLLDELRRIHEKNGWETFDRFVSRIAVTAHDTGCTLLARLAPDSIPRDRLASLENRFDGLM